MALSAINQEFLDLDFRVNPTSTNVLCHAVYIFDNPEIFVGTISSNHYLNADTSLLLPRQRDFKCDPEWVFCNELKKNRSNVLEDGKKKPVFSQCRLLVVLRAASDSELQRWLRSKGETQANVCHQASERKPCRTSLVIFAGPYITDPRWC